MNRTHIVSGGSILVRRSIRSKVKRLVFLLKFKNLELSRKWKNIWNINRFRNLDFGFDPNLVVFWFGTPQEHTGPESEPFTATPTF